MIPRSRVRVSGSALRNNYRILSRKVPGARMLPMVKADAYGHGAVFAARALLNEKNLEGFGVATFQEGMELRKALKGSSIPILVFSDSAPWGSELEALCIREKLEPVFSELTSLLSFQMSRRAPKIKAHVEFNTGMNRLGIPIELLSLIRFRPRSIFTHLALAEAPESSLTRHQLKRFSQLLEGARSRFPGAAFHFANSAAIWNHRHYPLLRKMDWVRPGLSLYGIRPFREAKEDGLRRVLQWSSRVVNVLHLGPKERVGYGGTYVCRKPSGERIAILGAGYADGVFRSLSNQGVAYFGQKKLRFVGRVSMDLSAVEGHPRITVGDELELWGDRVDPYEQAFLAGTIPYEITTRIGARVCRELDES